MFYWSFQQALYYYLCVSSFPKLLSDEEGGFVDRVAQDVFLFLEEKRKKGGVVEATVQVSYMELYREELRDLLELHTIHKELHIREDERGNTGN